MIRVPPKSTCIVCGCDRILFPMPKSRVCSLCRWRLLYGGFYRCGRCGEVFHYGPLYQFFIRVAPKFCHRCSGVASGRHPGNARAHTLWLGGPQHRPYDDSNPSGENALRAWEDMEP